ncbi:hypothetical protein B0J12DRAFT_431077 [Macrophomina phaseolina]|uniref:Uncharacterized protein n=1 Tax=Macrophomina phaseolina TaxID=35725 RepID=A0ABQ8GH39_9PEZI|nr:hypothetical protein B0J12DRAFT_431077 [Macrophomina phaseolina]
MSPGTTKTETFIRTEGTTQTNTFTRIMTILPSTGHVQTPGAQMATPSTFRTLTRPVKSTYGYPGQTGGVKPTAMQGTVTHSTPYAYMGPENTASSKTPEYLPLTTPNMPLTTPNTYKGPGSTRTSKALEYLPLTTPYPSLMSNPYYSSPSWNQTYSLRSKMNASVHTTGMASASTSAKDPFYGTGTTITDSPTAAEGTSPPGYGMGLTRTITLTGLVTTKIPYPTAAESSPATPSSNFTEHSGSIGWTRPAHERLHGGPLSDMNEGLPAAARRPPLGSLAGAAHWPSNATQPQSPNSEGDGHSNATLARRDWHDPTALVHKDPLTGQMTIEVLPHLKCYHVGRSFKRKQMVPLIDQFCLNHDKAFLSAGEDIKEVGKVRHDGILYDRLIMRVKKLDWSESRIIDAASCRRNLRKIMDGCDTRTEEYKYGGKATFYAGPYAGEEWQLDPEMEH